MGVSGGERGRRSTIGRTDGRSVGGEGRSSAVCSLFGECLIGLEGGGRNGVRGPPPSLRRRRALKPLRTCTKRPAMRKQHGMGREEEEEKGLFPFSILCRIVSIPSAPFLYPFLVFPRESRVRFSRAKYKRRKTPSRHRGKKKKRYSKRKGGKKRGGERA